MDLLNIVPISEEVQSLADTEDGQYYLKAIRDIHHAHPEFFATLLTIGGYCQPTERTEFEHGNQFALGNIAAQLAFVVKFNGERQEVNDDANTTGKIQPPMER